MSTATIEETRTATAPGATRGITRTGAAPAAWTGSRTASATVGSRTDTARTGAVEGAGATAPFVLLTMVLLASGLVATLWLSTAAAADSYRLEEARQVARDLSEQSERLHRDVEGARSAPALAAAARAQGMVPGGDPAVLLVAPDGSTRVVGDPRAAKPAPRPAPARPAQPTSHPPRVPGPAVEDERLQAAPATTDDTTETDDTTATAGTATAGTATAGAGGAG